VVGAKVFEGGKGPRVSSNFNFPVSYCNCREEERRRRWKPEGNGISAFYTGFHLASRKLPEPHRKV
jgi:hypothetical protein